MPYIKQEEREKYDVLIQELAGKIAYECIITDETVDVGKNFSDKKIASSAGVLNYCITELISELFKRLSPEGIRYWHIALISGILDNVSSEYYRRKAATYEDKKIQENGDVTAYGNNENRRLE